MVRRLVILVSLVLWPRWAISDTAANRQAGRELLAEGAKAFRLGEFEKAIDDFKKSYDTYPDPIALYNIAQVYRQQKQNEKAIFFYQQYLTESPHAQDRAKIEQRIKELREVIAAQKDVTDKPPDGVQQAPPPASPPVASAPEPTPTPTSEAPPVTDTPSTGRPIYQWAIAGGGVAIAAVGIGLLVSAGGLDDDAKNATTASQQHDLRNQASSRKTLGSAVAIGGGLVAAAGITLLILNPGSHGHAESPSQQTAIIVGPSWLGVRGSF